MAFEIAVRGDVVVRAKNAASSAPSTARDLGERPDVELALLAFGIGVERSAEGAPGRRHLAREPRHRLARAAAEERVAGALVARAPAARAAARCRRASSRNAAPASARRPNSARSRRRDDRRCRPGRCARASARPRRNSARRRCAAPARQRNSSIMACGNFGAPRMPPLVGSIMPAICGAARSSSAAPMTTLPCGRALSASRAIKRRAVVLDALRLLAEEARDLAQHVDEGRPAVARGLGKIGAAPDRLAGGREEHGQRPAALLAEDDAAPTCRSGRCRAAPRDRP